MSLSTQQLLELEELAVEDISILHSLCQTCLKIFSHGRVLNTLEFLQLNLSSSGNQTIKLHATCFTFSMALRKYGRTVRTHHKQLFCFFNYLVPDPAGPHLDMAIGVLTISSWGTGKTTGGMHLTLNRAPLFNEASPSSTNRRTIRNWFACDTIHHVKFQSCKKNYGLVPARQWLLVKLWLRTGFRIARKKFEAIRTKQFTVLESFDILGIAVNFSQLDCI